MVTKWKNPKENKPAYAVIFISKQGQSMEGYQELDDLLMQEVQKLNGFMGYSSRGDKDGSIFISYWRNQEAIEEWKAHQQHQVAKSNAYSQWYDYIHTMICKVESSKIFEREL